MTLSNVLIGKWMTRGQRYLMTISRRIWVTQLPNSLLSLVLPEKKTFENKQQRFSYDRGPFCHPANNVKARK